jgi:hypothetical protein
MALTVDFHMHKKEIKIKTRHVLWNDYATVKITTGEGYEIQEITLFANIENLKKIENEIHKARIALELQAGVIKNGK